MPTEARSVIGVLDTIAQKIGSPGSVFPEDARSAGMEEVFIVYSKGWGEFSKEGPPFYINLLVDMYDFAGRWVGFQSGVNFTREDPLGSLRVPEAPPLPIDTPPAPNFPASSWTKGLFTFKDGALLVQGPALTHLTPLTNGDLLFSVTTSHLITAGTGLYEGARGMKQATGTALVPHDLITSGKFPAPGLRFPVTTIETFRLIRKQFLEEAAGSGGMSAAERPSLGEGGRLEGGPLKPSREGYGSGKKEESREEE